MDATPSQTFEQFIALPQNQDKVFESIQGAVIEVPSNPYSSQIAARIGRYVDTFADEHDLGHVTGEAGGYQVGEDRYAPDVAFISKAKQDSLPYYTGYNPNPPDLAVEIVSPTDNQQHLRLKLSNYAAVGTVVWVVYPPEKQVEIYIPGKAATVLEVDDTLTGGEVLPGFSMPVAKIFP